MAIGKAQKAKQKLQYILAIFFLVSVAVGATVLAVNISKQEKLDSKFCKEIESIPGHLIILIDGTDKLTYTQQQSLKIDVSRRINNLETGTLVSVFTLDENFQANSLPVIHLCNPGKFEDGDNKFTKSKAFAYRQFQERFESPVMEKINMLATTEANNSSPILEMLQLVGINGFRRSGIDRNQELIIYSDFLHNTKSFNMYKSTLDFDTFSLSIYGMQTMPKLTGVSVKMKYLMHSPRFQGDSNRRFWLQLFRQSGAKIESVKIVEG